MKVTFLGTGTSQGIPVIGCECDVCISDDPRDKRLRTSVFVENNGFNILVDVGPDFRQQMLRAKVKKLDAVLLTHEHNDHMIGADDLRPFNFRQKKDMPIYAELRVLEEIKDRFKYAFIPHPYPGIPQFLLNEVHENVSLVLNGFEIIPIRIMHGDLPIFGFRFGDFCYLTDVKTIPDGEFNKLENIKVLVLNTLRKEKHHSHLTLDEAISLSTKIGAEKTYLLHFSHDLGRTAIWEQELPENIMAAYDGLILEI